MTDHSHAAHHGPESTSPYIKVFVLLCIFTAISFVVNYFTRNHTLSTEMGFVLILGVAVVKALLVICIFITGGTLAAGDVVCTFARTSLQLLLQHVESGGQLPPDLADMAGRIALLRYR